VYLEDWITAKRWLSHSLSQICREDIGNTPSKKEADSSEKTSNRKAGEFVHTFHGQTIE
ncbi:hypothetical protein L9F63_001489, partial [Diploptera punctata]